MQSLIGSGDFPLSSINYKRFVIHLSTFIFQRLPIQGRAVLPIQGRAGDRDDDEYARDMIIIFAVNSNLVLARIFTQPQSFLILDSIKLKRISTW